MQLALWNIAGGLPLIARGQEWSRDNYQEENIQTFIDILLTQHADVISLQELHAEDNNTSEQLKKLQEQLTMHATPPTLYGKSHIKVGSHLAMSILSKFPIQKSAYKQTPNPQITILRPDGKTWVSLDCGFLVSEIRYQEELVYIVDGHLVPYHYFQRDFAESAFDHIRQAIADILVPLAEKPTIIAADFNIDHLDMLIPGLFPTYHELFHQDTTPSKGQQDHILVSKHWDVLEWKVEKSISDHYLCTASVELNK